MAAPQATIPRSSGGWPEAKATYRFFDNDKVDPNIIYNRHRESILPRVQGEPVVLAVADTTMLDYTAHPETAGLGPLSDAVHHGFLFHPTLLLTPQRVPLGVIDAQTWVRDIDKFGSSKAARKSRAIDEKESKKWLGSMEAAEEFQRDVGSETTVVSVFDREGDTYDVLATAFLDGRQSRVLVRAQSDRRIQHPQQKIWQHMEAQPVAMTMVGRETPDLPCTVVFEDYEWKALWVFVFKDPNAPPETTPTLREVTRMIGRLGGHLGRKRDGEPGILTMWRGLQRLPDIAEMWQVFDPRR